MGEALVAGPVKKESFFAASLGSRGKKEKLNVHLELKKIYSI